MTEVLDPKDLLFIGTYGYVKAIDKQTGEDRWQVSLPATGYDRVSLFCEGFRLFAASKGYVFALDARTGEIIWTNGLSGLGHDDVSLAVQAGSAEPPPLPKPEEKQDFEESSNESETPSDSD
jgi:glucose dehydrogenase